MLEDKEITKPDAVPDAEWSYDEDAIVAVSARRARRLLGPALGGRDDNRVFFIPLRLLRALELSSEGRDEVWADCHHELAEGTGYGGAIFEPREWLIEALSTVRAVETDQPFVF